MEGACANKEVATIANRIVIKDVKVFMVGILTEISNDWQATTDFRMKKYHDSTSTRRKLRK